MAKGAKVGRRRAQEVAAMFAVAVIPRTFQRSLLPRSTVDQGVVTSITVALVYIIGLLTQDSIDNVVRFVSGRNNTEELSGKTQVLIGAAAIGVGLLSEKYFRYEPTEKLPRSAARTSGKWVQAAGVASAIIGAVELFNESVSKDKAAAAQRDLLTYFIAGGLLYSLIGEYTRVRGNGIFSIKDSVLAVKPARAIGIGAGVTAALAGVVYGERFIAHKVDDALGDSAKRLKLHWLSVGHLVGLGTIGAGLYGLMRKIYGDIEHGAGQVEVGFTRRPSSTYVSGNRDSLVSWESLSVQGRRHVSTALTARHIEAVMGELAKPPIRIFVGIDSAQSTEARVQLALAELERTGAYERACILVVSPTGTGYVNYVMSESVEYMARGDVASVAMQYSKRPSPLSLDKVDDGHIQYRMLLNAISKRVREMPEQKRPRILLFGESLGAWTSQDAFMQSGTDGLRALSIDRALWIGTPMGSKWKEQVLSGSRLNTDSELIGTFNDYTEFEALSEPAQRALRYIMVTHYNDPIAQFGLELLIKQPAWVSDATKRPSGMNASTRYRTPTLFVQTLLDMKNALKPVPGKFVGNAHDYRADLARFVAATYDFTVDATQLEAIESALRNNEIAREKRIRGEA